MTSTVVAGDQEVESNVLQQVFAVGVTQDSAAEEAEAAQQMRASGN